MSCFYIQVQGASQFLGKYYYSSNLSAVKIPFQQAQRCRNTWGTFSSFHCAADNFTFKSGELLAVGGQSLIVRGGGPRWLEHGLQFELGFLGL